jgi:transposase-like protein
MHKRERARKITGTGGKDKTMVAGALQRGSDGKPSQVRAAVLPDRKRETLRAHIGAPVEPGSTLYSDEYSGYTGLESDYAHKTVNHAVEYVSGRVYTNGIENFWALFKRGLRGTYVCPQAFHMFRYLDERMFTFNQRDLDDLGRMVAIMATVAGRRVTYKKLTGKTA